MTQVRVPGGSRSLAAREPSSSWPTREELAAAPAPPTSLMDELAVVVVGAARMLIHGPVSIHEPTPLHDPWPAISVDKRLHALEAELAGLRQMVYGISSNRARHVLLASRHEAPVPNDVARAYVIDDHGAVASYLQQHHDLARILVDAARELTARFAPSELRLSVDEDRLLLEVCLELDAAPAYERYSRFVKEWWINHVTPRHGVLVTLTFV